MDVGNPTDIFGFGAGVLQPGFGVNNAYDTINRRCHRPPTPSSPPTTSHGPLINVRLNVPGHASRAHRRRPQQPAARADRGRWRRGRPAARVRYGRRFNVTPHQPVNIQVNGNLPNLTNWAFGEPQGDELNVTVPVRSTSSATRPPAQCDGHRPPALGPVRREVQLDRAQPVPPASNGIVNIIGDNNDPAGPPRTTTSRSAAATSTSTRPSRSTARTSSRCRSAAIGTRTLAPLAPSA